MITISNESPPHTFDLCDGLSVCTKEKRFTMLNFFFLFFFFFCCIIAFQHVFFFVVSWSNKKKVQINYSVRCCGALSALLQLSSFHKAFVFLWVLPICGRSDLPMHLCAFQQRRRNVFFHRVYFCSIHTHTKIHSQRS